MKTVPLLLTGNVRTIQIYDKLYCINPPSGGYGNNYTARSLGYIKMFATGPSIKQLYKNKKSTLKQCIYNLCK